MAAVDILEAPLVKVPFESVKRAAKDRKTVIDEAMEEVTAATSASSRGGSKDEQIESLTQLLSRLQGLKRKLLDVSKVERDDAHRCKARLEHLRAVALPGKEAALAWNKHRLDRLLAEHLLRCGHHASGVRLTKEVGIVDLVDSQIFADAQKVVAALRAHDCSAALAWCAEHRAKLRKGRSRLEFRLHLQEFLELVRAERRLDAIAHARTHLAPWAASHMAELQRAMATLAFTAHTKRPPYRALFDESQWEALVELFYRDLFKLHALTPESLLTVHLQAGLSALKVPQSYQPGCSKEDPLHLPAFQRLAEYMPYAKHVTSKLVCAVTKEMMNDANPPIALPNGHVYTQKAIDAIAAQNGGKVVCPRTGNIYALDELRRAFIV